MSRSEAYSLILHHAAEKWGLSVIPGCPLIDDHTNPYPRPKVCETLRWGNGKYESVEIELFVINDQWSYAMDASFSEGGWGYGPCLKFCNPHPTRSAALRAALLELKRHVQDDLKAGYRYRSSGPAIRWLENLTEPTQLALF